MQRSLLICHSGSRSTRDSCSAAACCVLAQRLGQAEQPRALLMEGYLMCPTACPGASREKEELRRKRG